MLQRYNKKQYVIQCSEIILGLQTTFQKPRFYNMLDILLLKI
jgi:hypothetical protein